MKKQVNKSYNKMKMKSLKVDKMNNLRALLAFQELNLKFKNLFIHPKKLLNAKLLRSVNSLK